MSYDPYAPDDSAAPPPDSEAVRNRVQMPAIFLIVVGVLNALAALYPLFNVVMTASVPAGELVRAQREQAAQMEKVLPGVKEAMEKQLAGKNPDEVKTQAMLYNGGGALLWLLAGLLPIFGGMRMMKLRSYGLAVLAAIVTAIPCVSPTGCCCLGEAIGLWALIVLLNGEVRSAFR